MKIFRSTYILLLQLRALAILYINKNKRIFLVDVDNTIIIYDVGSLRVGDRLNLSEGEVNRVLLKWLERECSKDCSTIIYIATARGLGSFRELRVLNKELRFKGILMFGSTKSKIDLLNLWSSKINSLVLIDDLCDYSKSERSFMPVKADISKSINYLHPNEIH